MAPATRRAGADRPAEADAAAASAPPPAAAGGWLVRGETDEYDGPAPVPGLHAALLAVALAPALLAVPPNAAIVATPTLAILAGAWRSVKPAPPTETMTQKDAMRFPLIGRCGMPARGAARACPAPRALRACAPPRRWAR